MIPVRHLLTLAGPLLAALAIAPAADATVVVGSIGLTGSPTRIGPVRGHYLELGRATVQDVRDAEGRKPRSDSKVMGRSGVVGRSLTFRIKEGSKTCRHEYDFTMSGRRRLADFTSTCKATRTVRGAKVGMTVAQAQAKEGGTFVYSPGLGHDCTFEGAGMALPSAGGIWLVVWADTIGTRDPNAAKVASIALHGADGVVWKAACM